MQDRVVICMKWGTLYSANYVNVLYRACLDNITGPFRFVCLTDDPSGIATDVETFPIPNIGLLETHYYDGAWPKIGLFLNDLYGLEGRALFIDLDMVILSNLDEMFEMPGEVITIDEGHWKKEYRRSSMTSIFAYDLGRNGYIAEKLMNDRDALVDQYKIEQAYLHGVCPNMKHWPTEWILSFKRHVRQPLGFDRLYHPNRPGGAAKIIAFHGRPRPIDLIDAPKGNWDIFPHYGRGPVPWMVDYWEKYGGRS